MGDYNLNAQPADGPTPEHHSRRGALPQWLAILIVALALVTLVLMIMLISAAREGTDLAAEGSGAQITRSTDTTTTTTNPIIVVQKTDYMTENAAASGGTTTQVSSRTTVTEVEPEPAASPAAEAAPADDPLLTGVDEDVAAARAKKQGLTPISVYGFPAIAASSGVELPPAGQVFRWEPFYGRTLGEKFAFLYVQTTEPRSRAITVPSVQGKPWKQARSTLVGAGLGIRYVYEEESPSTYGTVVFQAPSAGSMMPAGSTVVVVLAD